MTNDKIPSGTNVLIMNSVAQAGININDKDIDAQILVGKFDPLGFIQFLGRVGISPATRIFFITILVYKHHSGPQLMSMRVTSRQSRISLISLMIRLLRR